MTLKRALKHLAERDPRFSFYEGGYRNGGTVKWIPTHDLPPRITSISSIDFYSAMSIAHMIGGEFQTLRADYDRQVVRQYWMAEWWMMEEQAIHQCGMGYETVEDATAAALTEIILCAYPKKAK